MLHTRWEYLVVVWELTGHQTEKSGGPSQPATYQVSYTEKFGIFRPGATEVDTRVGTPGVLDQHWGSILNEVGSDGWELVTDTVAESAAYSGETRGFKNTVSFPIGGRWIFKRRVEE